MPFPIAVTNPQKTTLRTSGYFQRTLVALNPSDVVFRAQSAVDISDAPFITFAWDNADVGAYTDVLAGMVCYLSATTSIRDAFYRGRVRLTPSSTEFYIDENASILTSSTYIIVVRDADLFARIRRDTLVDGSVTYHNLPPMIAALPSTLCLYDSDNDGNVSYTAVQTGVAVASGATIASWLWTISGSGTTAFTSGTSTSQNPTIQFQAGYHYLVRCRVTDSNGVQNFQFVQVYAITRTFTAPINTTVVTGSIENDIDNGYSASLIGYADLTTLVDRTHCAVFSVEHFGDDSSTPIVTNVLMNGRIRSDSISTVGSDEAGQVQEVAFTVEGITSYLQRLRIPSDIVRNVAAPDEWGEMVNPNPYRMAVYVMWAYTTLTNICSFSPQTGAFDAWRVGAEPVAIDGEFAIDLLRNLLWERVKAQPNFAPTGEIYLVRNTNYLPDRSAVVTVLDFVLQDIRDLTIDRDSSRVTAQVIAYGGVFETAINQFTLYTAQSPSIVYGDAPETKELTREVLTYDSAVADASEELSGRASNHYAFENPKPFINVILYDSMAWLIATNYLRYTFTIPAADNTLGIAYTTANYWWLQRVSLTINTDGSVDVSAEFPAETEFSDAQVMASLLPNNLSNLNPVLPVLPNDPAFPTDPLELYPSDSPGIDDLQPIDNFSLSQTQMPFPPDVAAEVAENQGSTRCQALAVNFRNSSNVTSPKTTALSAAYTISMVGETIYSDNSWIYHLNFASSLGGFAITSPWGTWTGGSGVDTGDGVEPTGPAGIRSIIVNDTISSTTLTSVTMTFDITKGTFTAVTPAAIIFLNGGIAASVLPASLPDGTDKTLVWTGSGAVTTIGLQILSSYDGVLPYVYGGSALLKSVTITGTGTNPFTGAAGSELNGDAFYIYSPDDADGSTAQLYGTAEGLRLDNAAVSAALIPPYAANHSYQIPFTGTGNQLLARMQFNSYTVKQNKNLQLQVCRVPS